MNVYSGECEHGLCGTKTDLVDNKGDALRVGDIVMLSYQASELSSWHHGLSVVVEGRPNLTGNAPIPDAFVMGICSVNINTNTRWVVTRVKKWEEVLDGENWSAYGFNYRISNPAVTGDSEAGVRCRGVVGSLNKEG